ncbi:MAG: hypothetical protein WEC75_10460 [Dehalococcoidia bacterium]
MRMHLLRGSLVVLALSALVAACDDDGGGGGGGGTPGPGVTVAAVEIVDGNRPAVVPDVAEILRSNEEFGDPAATSDDDAHRLFSITCADATMTIATTKEIIYAELPCDRALPPPVVDRFAGDSVRVRVQIGEQIKLFFESSDGGSVEFTTGRIWIDEQ